jgi:cytochrome c peroxidase
MRAQSPGAWLGLMLCAVPAWGAAPDRPWLQEPLAPLPIEATEDPARVRLGERLFADPRLSHDRQRSCATCHPLDNAGVDGYRRARATRNLKLLRNTPTIFNLRYDLFYNWDGAADNLQAHNEKVLLSPALMATQWPELLARLGADPIYGAEFARCGLQLTPESVLDVLAAYERSLTTPDSRFDRFLRGDPAAINDEERHGYELFKDFGCRSCHQGINVGGNLRQKFGVFEDTAAGAAAGEPADAGLWNDTHDELDRGVFRVPSLRNVALTAPYFHDGRAATLELAVATMARVQLGRRVSPADVQAIVAFLRTLTGEYQGRPLQRRSAAGQAP